MKKNYVLISGPTIAHDEELTRKLQEITKTLRNLDNNRIESILSKRKVDLILLEISKDFASEIEMIGNIKSQFPNMEIILINGNGKVDVLAKAFSYGARDAFRKPYKIDLIVERVGALLK